MKKSLIIVLLLLLNVGLIYFFVFRGDTSASKDERTTIVMNKKNADYALAEMRGFLESIQQINEGILDNDPSKIAKAGHISGEQVKTLAPPGMMKALPMGFKTLGFATHDLFEELSQTTTQNFDPQKTRKQMSTILNNCVTCHRAYKIEVLTNN